MAYSDYFTPQEQVLLTGDANEDYATYCSLVNRGE